MQWDQKPGPDGSEPDKPAPSLTLAAGGGDSHGTVDATVSVDETTNTTDTTARWLGGIGLVLGALGAALGIGATLRGRRS